MLRLRSFKLGRVPLSGHLKCGAFFLRCIAKIKTISEQREGGADGDAEKRMKVTRRPSLAPRLCSTTTLVPRFVFERRDLRNIIQDQPRFKFAPAVIASLDMSGSTSL